MRFEQGLLCVALMAATSVAAEVGAAKVDPEEFDSNCFECLANSNQFCTDNGKCISKEEDCAKGDAYLGLDQCELEDPAEGFACPQSMVLKPDAVYPKIESGVPLEGDAFLKNIVKMGPG